MELESAPHASGSASGSTSSRPSLARDPSSNSGRPKGILKNAHPTAEGGTVNEGVRWDEVNLNLNEVEKEATTRMQITEPKTPYVRYNAETDEVMDLDKIPGFELGQAEREDQQQALSQSTGEGDSSNANHDMHEGGSSTSGASDSARPTLNNRAPSASSRSSSFSGSRRGSETSRRGSDVSERKMVVVEDLGPGADAEDEGADEETRKAKKEFKERRGSHYSGEGEVMKRFRAGMIKDDEDDDDDNDEAIDMDDDEDEEDDKDESSGTISGGANGQQATGVNGQGSRRTRNIPPVPPIPNGLA